MPKSVMLKRPGGRRKSHYSLSTVILMALYVTRPRDTCNGYYAQDVSMRKIH